MITQQNLEVFTAEVNPKDPNNQSDQAIDSKRNSQVGKRIMIWQLFQMNSKYIFIFDVTVNLVISKCLRKEVILECNLVD